MFKSTVTKTTSVILLSSLLICGTISGCASSSSVSSETDQNLSHNRSSRDSRSSTEGSLRNINRIVVLEPEVTSSAYHGSELKELWYKDLLESARHESGVEVLSAKELSSCQEGCARFMTIISSYEDGSSIGNSSSGLNRVGLIAEAVSSSGMLLWSTVFKINGTPFSENILQNRKDRLAGQQTAAVQLRIGSEEIFREFASARMRQFLK